MPEPLNLGVLFPELRFLSESDPIEASKVVKQNPLVENIASLSELVDAFWWCLYGYVYTDKNQEYINNKDYLLKDLFCLVKCENLRMISKTHRYPITQRKLRGRKASDNQMKLINSYQHLLEQVFQTLKNQYEEGSSQIAPLQILTNIRDKQEYLLGYKLDAIKSVRQCQYNKIMKLLASIFIHRNFIIRNKEEGGELLTLEEANEWEEAQDTIKTIYADNDTPFFIKNLIKMESVIIVPFL